MKSKYKGLVGLEVSPIHLLLSNQLHAVHIYDVESWLPYELPIGLYPSWLQRLEIYKVSEYTNRRGRLDFLFRTGVYNFQSDHFPPPAPMKFLAL